MPQQLNWQDAIIRVLKDNGTAMHYKDIADQIVEKQLRTQVGATPATTVSSVITTNIQQKDNDSLFTRTSPGEYLLKQNLSSKNTKTQTVDILSAVVTQDLDASEETSAVKALGIYWRRDRVNWTSTPKLLGVQQKGAKQVDFGGQRGIYLLHDGRTTVYVGRVTEQPLSKRLLQHTIDRLNGRWDRFSWFGLLAVTAEGTLSEPTDVKYTSDQMIYDLEAVLIETLEPALNRRRGDGLTTAEYIQIEDAAQKQRQLLKELESRLSSSTGE